MNRLFIIFCFMASVRATKPVAIKLVDIEVLTFKKNHQTTTAKSLSFPQLKCSGQNCKHAPDVVKCVNVGIDDYGEVNWRCEADLPSWLSFGKVDISCEGFPKGSANVLVGSCRFKYSLFGTNPSIGGYLIIALIVFIIGCKYPCCGAGLVIAAALLPRKKRGGRKGIWGSSTTRRTAKAFVSKTHIR